MNFIKGNNSVVNNTIIFKFPTELVITVPNIFPYLRGIEMLTHFEIIANSKKYCLHFVTIKGNNSIENESSVSRFGNIFVSIVNNIFYIFSSLTCIYMLTD